MITTSEVKQFLGVTSTVNDSLITTFTNYVIAEIESYCGRTLTLTTYTGATLKYEDSTFDNRPQITLDTSEGYPKLYLQQYPVTTVTSFTYKDNPLVATDDYMLNTTNGVIEMYTAFNDLKDNIEITYVAGYDSAPNDLKLVICQGVKAMYAESGATSQNSGGISSKKVGDFSVNYGAGNSQYSDGSTIGKTYLMANRAILNRYRKVLI